MTVLNTIARDNSLEALGEKLGQFKAYANDLPIAEITGTRIVKCLYQINKKTGEKVADNAYVRIPTKHLTEQTIIDRISDLAPYILNYLQSEEDKIIKEDHRKGALQVYTEYLTLDKIVEALEISGNSGRLNKEKIEAWFTAIMYEPLLLLVADKVAPGRSEFTPAEEYKIELSINAYKELFISLASPKTVLPENCREALINVITKCGAESDFLGSRFIKRIESMSKNDNNDLLLGL